MKLAFILDPLDSLTAYKDSSVAMMRAAAKRGHEVWAIQRAALTWREGRVAARAQKILPTAGEEPWYSLAGEAVLPLTAYDAVLMRQDPPFDFEYVAATWLLERAEAEGARVRQPQARPMPGEELDQAGVVREDIHGPRFDLRKHPLVEVLDLEGHG